MLSQLRSEAVDDQEEELLTKIMIMTIMKTS